MHARVFTQNSLEPVIHNPALALARKVVALVNDGAGLAGRTGGFVCAGIGHHEDIDELLRVVLLLDGANEVGDDRFLVMGGDEVRIVMECLGLGIAIFALHDADEEEDDLVEKDDPEQHHDDQIELHDGRSAEKRADGVVKEELKHGILHGRNAYVLLV